MIECALGGEGTQMAGAEWIAAALVVDAIIVAGAIFLPKLRRKILLAAAVGVFVTALTLAFLLPPRLCVGLGGWVDVSLDFRILVAGVGFVLGLILASFARKKPFLILEPFWKLIMAARRSFNP